MAYSATSQKKLLYVDGLNYAHDFFEGKEHWSSISNAPGRIERFVAAAERAGWEMVIFVDEVRPTDEAEKKWVSRREQEVLKGSRNIPQGISTMLPEAFLRLGCEVLYSLEADNDDTVAAFAHAHGAAVLSRDKDFFRYRGARYTVYRDFSYDKYDNLKLEERHPSEVPSHPEPRDLFYQLPKTRSGQAACWNSSRRDYASGAPSPLIRQLGNPHVGAKLLRAAMYASLGVPLTEEVEETFPIWDDVLQKPGWYKKKQYPSLELSEVLRDADAAFEAVFPPHSTFRRRPPGIGDVKWRNHLCSLHAVVYEICCMVTGDRLLDLLLNKAQELRSEGSIPDADAPEPDEVLDPGLEIGYRFNCRFCSARTTITQNEVEYISRNGWQMPSQCKDCKNRRNSSRQGNRRW